MRQIAKPNIFVPLLFILVLYINLFYFISLTSNPYIRSDAWIELQHFLIGFWETGWFSLEDLYRIRSVTHHAHPMHRILLACNAVWLGLDFRLEALFASFFVLGILFVLLKDLLKAKADAIIDWRSSIAIVALGACVINLNTTVNYLWSLVTLGYIPIFIIVCFYVHLSNKIINNQKPSVLTILLVGLLLFVADDSGMVALISAILVSLAYSILLKTKTPMCYTIVLGLMLVLYLIWRSYIVDAAGTPSGTKASVGSGVQYMLSHPSEWFKSITIPLADSVVHKIHLKKLFGEHTHFATSVLGLLILGVHICCVYVYFKYQMYKKTLLPMLLLLFGYGLIMGIVLYRVPNASQGAEYLHQPRYGRTLQLSLWACAFILTLYMFDRNHSKKLGSHLVTFGALVVIALQCCFISSAWRSKKFVIKHNERRAEQVLYFAGIAETEAPCTTSSKSKFCSFKDEKKKYLVNFLQENELNFFNPRIIERHQKLYYD